MSCIRGRYLIDADERPLLSLVAPFSPRADVEEHIAHIIITQRPSALISILVSIEFCSMRDRSGSSEVCSCLT